MAPDAIFKASISVLDEFDAADRMRWLGDLDLWKPSLVSSALRGVMERHRPYRAFHNTEKFQWECQCSYGEEFPCLEFRYIAIAMEVLANDD